MQIRAFTVRDLTADPSVARGLADPLGYATITESWVQLLASNPLAKPEDLALLLAVEDDTIVGRLGFYAGEGVSEGRSFRTYWMDGFFLDPRFRSTGAGGMLLLRGLSACKSVLACGGPAEETQKLYRAAGMIELGPPLRRFIYFYRTDPVIQKFVRLRPLAWLLGHLTSPLLTPYYAACGASVRLALDYGQVDEFDESLDVLLAERADNHFPRDSRTLNWVLGAKRMKAFEIRRGERLVGYCLLKTVHQDAGGAHNLPAMEIGMLLDYFLAEDTAEAKRDLVRFAIRHLRRSGVDLLEFQHADPELDRICGVLGLIRRGGNKTFFRAPADLRLPPGTPFSLTHATSDVILIGD